VFALPPISALTSNIIPLVGTILAFYSIVAVHEFGHFIFCKIFNVKTPTFSLGAGPVIVKKTFVETEFVLSLLPIGGFVEIGGLAEPGQGKQENANDTSERSFMIKPYWQKMLILWGGIIFNLAFAFVIYTSLYATGMPQGTLTNITIVKVAEGGPAATAGLEPNDLIVGINHKRFDSEKGSMTYAEFSKILQASEDKSVHFSIVRDEKPHTITVTPKADSPGSPAKIQAELASSATYTLSEGLDLATSVRKAYENIYEQVTGTFSMIKGLFTSRSLSGIGGPVMIMSQLFKSAKVGFRLLLLFVAYVNIGLAVMNTLPLGALDGGQIAFTTLEFIIRRPLSDNFKIWVNIVSIALFGLLLLYLIFKDTWSLLGW